MNNELEELKVKVNDLETRIIKLEKIEKRRKIMGTIKLIISIIITILLVISSIYFYNFITKEMPKRLNEKMKEVNPLAGDDFDFGGFIDDLFKNGKSEDKKIEIDGSTFDELKEFFGNKSSE